MLFNEFGGRTTLWKILLIYTFIFNAKIKYNIFSFLYDHYVRLCWLKLQNNLKKLLVPQYIIIYLFIYIFIKL